MSKRGHLFCGVISLFLLLAGCQPAKNDGAPLKYYVQLVRGNDKDTPPSPDARVIGPKLSQHFHTVFRWQSYWEIHREEVELKAGEKKRVRLSNEREAEIDLTQAGIRRVIAFENGETISSTSQSIGDAMSIVGGDRDAKSVWFIVVRRDPPPD